MEGKRTAKIVGPHTFTDKPITQRNKGGLCSQVIAKVDVFSVYCLGTAALDGQGEIYVSAGIHGGDPAPRVGLILWAERNVQSSGAFR